MLGNIVFLILLILNFIFFVCADKNNSKKLLIFGIIILSILSGFRGINVGVDTTYYYKAFMYDFPVSWQFKEEGFRIISGFLMKVLQHPTWLFVLFAVITNYLIIVRLWELKEKSNFVIMTLIYILVYYFNTMNIMRQFICVAIIFYSTKFLEKKKYLLYVVIVLLCTQIHKSSILALGILAIYCFDNFSKKNKILLSIPCIVLFCIGVKYVINFESAEISNYLGSHNAINNFNLTFIYRALIYIFAVILYKSKRKIVILSSAKKQMLSKKNENFKKNIIIYGIGLIFGSLGLFFNHAARIGLYYMVFEMTFWGFLTKNDKNKNLNIILIMTYAVYVFANELLFNGSKIFPFYVNFI